MEATPSTLVEVVTTSDILAQTNNLIAAMAFVGGLFGIAFTIAFAALVFLIWRHNEQSRKAQKEVEKIEQLRKTVESLFGVYKKHFAEMNKILKFFSQSSQTIARDTKAITKLSAEAKKSGANIIEIEKQIKVKQQSVDKETKNLFTVADIVSTEPLSEGQTLNPVILNASDLGNYYKGIQETFSQLPVKAMKEYAKEIKTAAEKVREAIAYSPVILRSRQPKKTALLRSKQTKIKTDN